MNLILLILLLSLKKHFLPVLLLISILTVLVSFLIKKTSSSHGHDLYRCSHHSGVGRVESLDIHSFLAKFFLSHFSVLYNLSSHSLTEISLSENWQCVNTTTPFMDIFDLIYAILETLGFPYSILNASCLVMYKHVLQL